MPAKTRTHRTGKGGYSDARAPTLQDGQRLAGLGGVGTGTSSADVGRDEDFVFPVAELLDHSGPLLNGQLPAQEGDLVPIVGQCPEKPPGIQTGLAKECRTGTVGATAPPKGTLMISQ